MLPQPCPAGSKTYRDIQCQAINDKFKIAYYRGGYGKFVKKKHSELLLTWDCTKCLLRSELDSENLLSNLAVRLVARQRNVT